MNNNFVKKHMDQLHRPATHVDRKRNQLLADEAFCKEGMNEYLAQEDNTSNSTFSSTFDNND